MNTLCQLLNVKPTVASLSPASFTARGGLGGVCSTGLSTEPVGQRHPHFYLSHTFWHTCTLALCNPTTTTSPFTSSGPFITPGAPLGRTNGMAELLVLERDVMRRVEQRAEEGSLIELGWVVWSWRVEGRKDSSLAHVAVSLLFSSHCPTTSSFFICFLLLSAFCLSLSHVHCISVSPALYLQTQSL